MDFHGEKRINDTHASITDPEARLFRKGKGKEAKLAFIGHVLMENRNGLVVDSRLNFGDRHSGEGGCHLHGSGGFRVTDG